MRKFLEALTREMKTNSPSIKFAPRVAAKKEPTIKMPKGKLTPAAAARVRAQAKGYK